MSDQIPQRTLKGVCPNCGPTQIDVVLEGSSHFNGISTPNWWCVNWIGWCCKCRVCLEAYLDDGKEVATLEWIAVDDEKVDFLFGDSSPTPTHSRTDPS